MSEPGKEEESVIHEVGLNLPPDDQASGSKTKSDSQLQSPSSINLVNPLDILSSSFQVKVPSENILREEKRQNVENSLLPLPKQMNVTLDSKTSEGPSTTVINEGKAPTTQAELGPNASVPSFLTANKLSSMQVLLLVRAR